jgi:hypothetical protein
MRKIKGEGEPGTESGRLLATHGNSLHKDLQFFIKMGMMHIMITHASVCITLVYAMISYIMSIELSVYRSLPRAE